MSIVSQRCTVCAMVEQKFGGPLFIVGMPRSGTKLLRDLLNRHPRVGIPLSESQFIPHFAARFPPDANSSSASVDFIDQFHTMLAQTVFYQNMRRITGREITREQLADNVDDCSLGSVFKAVLQYYAPADCDENPIWGDKTPAYMMHIPLLQSIFPDARFLHIIRDFRDCSLSISRAWSQNIERAAEKWRRCIAVAREDGARIGDSYMEIKYRDLLLKPEDTLQRVCTFIDCRFIPDMLSLKEPREGLGDAKGYTTIKSDNLDKYEERLTKDKIKRLEEICYPMARQLGFPCHSATQFRPLHPIHFLALGVRDRLASIVIYARRKGVIRGVRYLMTGYFRGSWRYANIKRERQADHNSET